MKPQIERFCIHLAGYARLSWTNFSDMKNFKRNTALILALEICIYVVIATSVGVLIFL
jgi:hypothetical protein